MDAVFAKTPKGQEEITSRKGGLTPRVRRVLIMIDGKRSIGELRGMLPADDLQHTLGTLEEEGYIEILTSGTSAPPARMASITAFADLPDGSDPVRLQRARNFMINTLNTFVGSLGASSLLDHLEKAPDHATLRLHFDDWYHAMVMSRDGKREAETLRTRLIEII